MIASKAVVLLCNNSRRLQLSSVQQVLLQRNGMQRIGVHPSLVVDRFLSTTSTTTKEEEEDAEDDDATTTSSTISSIEPVVNPEYYVPKLERYTTGRSGFDLDHSVFMASSGETRLARNSRTCPTRELYFQSTQWNKHKSPYRKFRHMVNIFKSAPFQRLLFPDFFCITSVSIFLTYYNEYLRHSVELLELFGSGTSSMMMLTISSSTFAGATTAIGLLAGFRLNASYGRYVEGRKVWSDMNHTTRDIARQSKMWIRSVQPPQYETTTTTTSDTNDSNSTIQGYQTRMIKLCQAFPIALLFHLNDKGCHHNMKRATSKVISATFDERVYAEFHAELHDVYYPNNDDVVNVNDGLQDDYERLCHIKLKGKKGNVPLEVLICMSEIIIDIQSYIHPIHIRELEIQIQKLCVILGSSERIVKTPLPTGFTRHSSRLLFLWSNCLPLALYPMMGPIGTLPTALLTSYAVLGIEDISVQLEEPFDILPLRQFSDSMYDSIETIDTNFKNKKAITAKN